MFRKANPDRPDWGQITQEMRQRLLAFGDDGRSPREVDMALRRARLFASPPDRLRARLADLDLDPVDAEGADLVLRAHLNPFGQELDEVTTQVEDRARSLGWVLEERVVHIVEGG